MGGRVSTQVASEGTFFSIMADECTDVTTIEELTICCHWVESGVPEEHFIEILPLKNASAESIYSALMEYCREKNIQLERLIGMGFDGAATFSGDKSSKKVEQALTSCIVCPLSLSCPSTGFCASCYCYTRYQACLHYLDDVMEVLSLLPKRAESLKESQKVLDLTELKIVKPSDTR